MSFSSRMKKTADRLINKYGNSITLIHVHQGAYDTNTGDYAKTETRHDGNKGTFREYKSSELIDGVINSDDVQLTITSYLSISKSWLVEIKGERYRILHITRVYTQDDLVIYKVQLRK